MTGGSAGGRVARNGYGRRQVQGESKQTVMLFFRVSRICEQAIAKRAGRNRSAWLRAAVEAALRSQ